MHQTNRRKDYTWLWLFLLSIAVRLPYLRTAQVLQTEGTTYVTLARNLLEHGRYVGILGETELVMTSILPHLIALLGWVLGDVVLAGRVLSLLASALLVIPVYLLGRDMFSPRTGLWAALLLVGHPYLVAYSPLIRVEAPFLLLWLFGVYATWRSLQQGPGHGWNVGVPLFFGGAYLLKSEGAVYFALSWLLLLGFWLYRGYGRDALAILFLQGTLFLLITAPMVLWLSRQTGRFTLDTKGIVNYTIAHRIAEGRDYHRAAYGLGPEGSPAGPLLDRNQLVRLGVGYKRPMPEEPAYRRAWVRVILREGQLLLWPLLGRWWLLFGLIGVALALVRGRVAGVLFPLWYLLPAFFGVSTILFVWTRYLLPVVPLVALWVGYTVDVVAEVVGWGIDMPWLSRRRVYGFVGLGLVLFLLWTHPYTRPAWNLLHQVPDLELREAGWWLREFDPSPDKRIMSTTSQVPYYAQGIHVPMPVDDPDQILRYAQRRRVRYVVISETKDRGRPAAVWLDPRQAPEGWKVIYTKGDKGHRVVIYRLPEGDCGCGGQSP